MFFWVTGPGVRPVRPLTYLGWGCGGGGVGGVGRGGDDDDIGAQKPRAFSLQSRFTRYLQYFPDGGPSYMVMADDG